MRVACALLSLIWLVSACSPIDYKESGLPEGYEGKSATIHDSYEHVGKHKAYTFQVEKVDDVRVQNAAERTGHTPASGDDGLVGAFRDVPAQPVELALTARHNQLSYRREIASGTISFIPEAGKHYVVKGKAWDDAASVWIENARGERVSEIVGALLGKAEADRNPGAERSLKNYLFFSLSGGESGQMVEAKLGEPDRVVEDERGLMAPGLDQTIFHYSGLGQVHFNTFNESIFVRAIYPDNSFTASTLVSFLGVGSSLTKQTLARDLYRRDIDGNVEVLDDVARAAWGNRYADSGLAADAVSWLCRTLGEKGDGRYNEFLELLSARASSRKVSRHAKGAISENHPEIQFQIEQPEGKAYSR